MKAGAGEESRRHPQRPAFFGSFYKRPDKRGEKAYMGLIPFAPAPRRVPENCMYMQGGIPCTNGFVLPP